MSDKDIVQEAINRFIEDGRDRADWQNYREAYILTIEIERAFNQTLQGARGK